MATVTIDLNYLSEAQVKQLVAMFDNEEAYIENYIPLKAITRGLGQLLSNGHNNESEKIRAMFDVVNGMQDALILDDVAKWQNLVDTHLKFFGYAE